MENLLDILYANNKLCAQTTSEIYTIINVLKIWYQSEFVNDKPHIALAFFSAKGLLNSHIQHEPINGGQHPSNAQIIFNEDDSPTFIPDCLAQGKRAGFTEIANKNFSYQLL